MVQPSSSKDDNTQPRQTIYPFKKRFIVVPETPPTVEHIISDENSNVTLQKIATPLTDAAPHNHVENVVGPVNMEIASEEFALEWARSVTIIPIYCKNRSANLYLNRFISGSKGRCIDYKKEFFTPHTFKEGSGCADDIEWAYCIKYAGYNIQCLIDANILKVHEWNCLCIKCRNADTDEIPIDYDLSNDSYENCLDELQNEVENLNEEVPPEEALQTNMGDQEYKAGQERETDQEQDIGVELEVGQECEIGQECEVESFAISESSQENTITGEINYLHENPGPSNFSHQPVVLESGVDQGATSSGYKRTASAPVERSPKRQRQLIPIERPNTNNRDGPGQNAMMQPNRPQLQRTEMEVHSFTGVKLDFMYMSEKEAAGSYRGPGNNDDVQPSTSNTIISPNQSQCRFCLATNYCLQHCHNNGILDHDRNCSHGRFTQQVPEAFVSLDYPSTSNADVSNISESECINTRNTVATSSMPLRNTVKQLDRTVSRQYVPGPRDQLRYLRTDIVAPQPNVPRGENVAVSREIMGPPQAPVSLHGYRTMTNERLD